MSLVLNRLRNLSLLIFFLLLQTAWAQRIGPLVPDNQQQAKASSAERVDALRPPSLQLSLPSPAEVNLPPLGPDDLQRLQPQRGRPPVIGVHRRLPQGALKLRFSGGGVKSTAEGAWQSTGAGRLWRLKLTSPSARALRVHFRDFAIGAGRLWLHSEDGQAVGPYSGSGRYGDGDFWSGIVFGDSLTIEYLPDPAEAGEAVPFQIVEISHIWGDVLKGGAQDGAQWPKAAREGSDPSGAAKPLSGRIDLAVGAPSKKARLAEAIQSVKRSVSQQPLSPKAARPLMPGQPADFRLGPVDSPTLFIGGQSFRLEVPEDAIRVIFTLESVDSDVDVDLHVRYGEDNAVQDGRVVSDHASEGPTGNEKVVISLHSDPPLQAGTYFVSIALYDTGVVANCTLTAEVELEGEAQPTISGGTLMPGQPADFRLGPVDSPTLFTGDHSFRLEAPTGTTRVTFTLESVDPDVDVDLYVRFDEDNTIQNGRPVFDHDSRGFTGNERIGITRRSDPPLRAGTYFVSIGVYDTGVVAEGTLTATVETDAEDCHLDATCYPEWSSSATGVALMVIESSEGGSRACSGTLLNNRRQDLTPYFLTAAHCVQTEEEARSVTAFWSYQTRTCNGDLPDLQSVPQTEGAGLLSALGGGGRNPDGDITLLQLEGDLPAGTVFQGWDAAPQPVGSQVTGIHHPASADWGRSKRISFGQIIPESEFVTSDDTYFNVSWPVGQGYTEPGSSGSAVFSNSETVVGALSGGDIVGYACPTEPVTDYFTHFSALYPHIRSFIDNMLSPRQPVAFRLGPVDSPMLFSGDSSFQVEVPEDASRVTFTLESVDPDVNVDLYVRYGKDNAVQGGSVVSDYSSTGLTGNEQIVVTPQSAPPLRAGTWYVSLMLRTTGAVAEVTLTAEFDATAPPPAGDRIYYFPHLAVGAGWQTTLTYINYSAEEVSCRTEFLSDQGTPLMVSFPSLGPDTSRSDMLPPGGSVHEETDVGLSAPLAGGWARAACTGPVKASLLFRQYDSAGVPLAEAGVNAAAAAASRFVTFAEQAPGQAGTGVAYANPSDTAAVVTFTAKDEAGRTLDSVDQTLMPGGHGAQNMAGLFSFSSFTGSLEITSSEPIVTLSINAEAAPIFSSLPPGELDPSVQGPGTYYFPHLAVGASWQTTLTYINYSPREVTCRTDFYSGQGTPLTVSFPGRGPDASRSDMLPPGGSVHEETDVGLSAPLVSGWARADCTGPVKASLLFRQYDSAGVPTGEAGVNAAAAPATRFVTFAEKRQGQPGTAVAYANPSGTSTAVVTFTAKDAAGRTLDSVDRTLMPRGHGAQNMAGLFSLTSFTGSLEITSTEPIVSLSLNAEASPVFSSLPPGELEASAP